MCYISNIYLLALCWVFILSSGAVEARVFKDVKGAEIDATIKKVEGDKVSLELKKDSKVYHVPLSRLSVEDRDYIKAWAEENKNQVSEEGGSSGKEEEMKHNFDAPWPNLVSVDLDIEIAIVEEDEEKKSFIYHSPNYEFVCDVGLSKNVIKKFATMFEATREYCRLLPVSTMKAHVPGAQFRNKILLFEKKETYIKNGGPPASAGVFTSRDGGVVMVPLVSLGLKKVGSSYMYDYKGQNKVLPHELTHQLTDREYYSAGARGWFSEGLAEYIAVTPYRSGKYNVRTNLTAIKDYVTGYGKKGKGGRALGDDITAPNLKDYMIQPYGSFTANANFNYGLGLLITNYFFHMEEDTSNINAFLKALKDGKKGEEALAVLLNGRSWDEMEQAISKKWRSRGVKITFQ